MVPNSVTAIAQVERVQKLALKIVSGEWNTGYYDLLARFQIPTLQRRRSELSLSLLYKISRSECLCVCVCNFTHFFGANIQAL